jgi:hypothetical protein
VKGATAAAALALVAASATARADEPVTSRLYGTVRLDFGNTTGVDDEFAPTQAIEDDSSRISLHPRNTRVGIEITPNNIDSSVDLTGLIEADLGDGTGALGRPRLRHAYLRASRGRFELLAGHTWDLASPLVPSANGLSMMWEAGNTGAFRPQVRIGARTNGSKLRVRAAAAAVMPVSGKDLDRDGNTDGTVGGQALLEVEHDRGRLGVWGHGGQDQLQDRVNGSRRLAVLLGGAHLQVQLVRGFSLRGEAYLARNATDLRTGSGQSISADGKGVRTRGGWAELVYDGQVTGAGGIGTDDPDDSDVGVGGVTRNSAWWFSIRRRIWSGATFGLEIAQFRTRVRGDVRRDGYWSTAYLSLDW